MPAAESCPGVLAGRHTRAILLALVPIVNVIVELVGGDVNAAFQRRKPPPSQVARRVAASALAASRMHTSSGIGCSCVPLDWSRTSYPGYCSGFVKGVFTELFKGRSFLHGAYPVVYSGIYL